jgi:hypothetical protein
MSANAIAQARQLLEGLHFARVKRTVANENDILSIEIPRLLIDEDGYITRNHTAYRIHSNRLSDIPVNDRWKAKVAWLRYYGFADGDIFFHNNDCRALDSYYHSLFRDPMGHEDGGFDKPGKGTLITGKVVEGRKGLKFAWWFVCPPGFYEFTQAILSDSPPTENDLAGKLLTNGYPDTLWAMARLILYDSVQPFVDQNAEKPEVHPHFGKPYGKPEFTRSAQLRVQWQGMYLGNSPDVFVHELSTLLEPSWWETYQELAKQQIPNWRHAGGWHREFCQGCESEDPTHGHGWY